MRHACVRFALLIQIFPGKIVITNGKSVKNGGLVKLKQIPPSQFWDFQQSFFFRRIFSKRFPRFSKAFPTFSQSGSHIFPKFASKYYFSNKIEFLQFFFKEKLISPKKLQLFNKKLNFTFFSTKLTNFHKIQSLAQNIYFPKKITFFPTNNIIILKKIKFLTPLHLTRVAVKAFLWISNYHQKQRSYPATG